MANGIMVDEATYYNDSVTYTGESGSSTNRWCVEDCYDFIAINSTSLYPYISSVGTYFRLVNDIDFNNHDTYKTGFTNTTVIDRTGSAATYYGRLDGDGHNIKNVILRNYTSTGRWIEFYQISNCNFVNLIFMNCLSTSEVVYSAQGMTNCNFGIFTSGSTLNSLLTGVQKEDCTYNIKGSLSSAILSNLGTTSFIRTQINFDLTFPDTTQCFLMGMGSGNVTLDNSYITGRIKSNRSEETWLLGSVTMKNSYIAVELETPHITNVSMSYNQYVSASSTSFIDTELLGYDLSETAITNLYYLTTTQAQDAEYLQSIGFVTV